MGNMERFINWVFDTIERALIFMILLGVCVVSIITLVSNKSRNKDVAMTHMEFYGDTVVIKKYKDIYPTKYMFSGSEVDTLMAAFKKANKLSRYNILHRLDFDYKKTLTQINGVDIEFRYTAKPFRRSAVIILPSDWRQWNSYNYVILYKEKDFTNYLTKYKHIYKKEMRKHERKMRKLNKIIG